ncbi:hypothetical protein BG000_003421 [Podila horticola]|nr:hypothetical protein BG000_003421 [Podila horticola]
MCRSRLANSRRQDLSSYRTTHIGDPARYLPVPADWTTLSRNMRSLTIDTSNLTNTILSDHDRFWIENLRKLNVMKHICLDSPGPRGNAPSNRHWLHDLVAKNRRLKALALVGFSAQAGAFDPVNARFRISDYFNFASPKLTSLKLTMLALKNFDLSGAELGKTLRSCPCLTRLELEHVSLSQNYVPAEDLENHAAGLRELLLVNTKPMAWFCDLLQKWIPCTDFDRLLAGLPRLRSVTIGRFEFDPMVPTNLAPIPRHHVSEVVMNEDVMTNFRPFFPKAKVLPCKA